MRITKDKYRLVKGILAILFAGAIFLNIIILIKEHLA